MITERKSTPNSMVDKGWLKKFPMLRTVAADKPGQQPVTIKPEVQKKPPREEFVLPDGIRVYCSKGSTNEILLNLFLNLRSEGKKAYRSDLDSVLPPQRSRRELTNVGYQGLRYLKRLLVRHGWDIVQTGGYGSDKKGTEPFYSLEKLSPKKLDATPNSLKFEDNPASNKDVPLEDLDILNEAIGLEFISLILSGIASVGLKTISGNPSEVINNVFEHANAYRNVSAILNRSFRDGDANRTKTAEVKQGLTEHEKSRKIAEITNRIKDSIADENKSKQIAEYIFINTLFEEWYRHPNALGISERKRRLRYYLVILKRSRISPEKAIEIMRRHFSIPTSSPERKSPKAAVRS